MGNKALDIPRVEIWDIKGYRYYAHIWPEDAWNCLPSEQKPATAMLVHGIGWVDLKPIADPSDGEAEEKSAT